MFRSWTLREYDTMLYITDTVPRHMRWECVLLSSLTWRRDLHFNMFNGEAGRLALRLWSSEYLECNMFDGEAGRLALRLWSDEYNFRHYIYICFLEFTFERSCQNFLHFDIFFACGWNYMKPFGHSLVKYVVDVHANLQFHRITLRRGLGIVRLPTQPKKWRIERGWRSWDSKWRVLDGCEIDALSLELCSPHGNSFWAWRVFKQSSLDQNLAIWHITRSPAPHLHQTLPGPTLVFN